MENFREEDKYIKAKKRVEAMKAFYWHLFASLFAMVFLAVINYITSSDFAWSLIPIGAILLSIIIHWFTVFRGGSVFGKSWEERKIQEFMKEDENEQRKLYQ